MAAAAKRRYEFGRHETFAVRHGWLGKGLARVGEQDGAFRADLESADALGLGSRMVKSLQYWMEASGLTEVRVEPGPDGRNVRTMRLSPLGEAVLRLDPHLEYPATWWFVHLVLCRRDGSIWSWFFNDFRERRFDRASCLEAFLSHLRDHSARQPPPAVAQREVACLLLAYAAAPGSARLDPEDATACPLRELRLVVRHEGTGRYERVAPLDRVPVEAFLACADLFAAETGLQSLPLPDLVRRRHGPARAFGITGDLVDEAASAAAAEYAAEGVEVTLLGAERHLRFPGLPPEAWLERHFSRIGAVR